MQMEPLCFLLLFMPICVEVYIMDLLWNLENLYGLSGVILFILMMDGYCLYRLCITLGTNEFLGTTVITNMITVIPVGGSGKFVMYWI